MHEMKYFFPDAATLRGMVRNNPIQAINITLPTHGNKPAPKV